MDNEEYLENLLEALDHIKALAETSSSQTKRLRTIALRAEKAINGERWESPVNIPVHPEFTQREKAMATIIRKFVNPDFALGIWNGEDQ